MKPLTQKYMHMFQQVMGHELNEIQQPIADWWFNTDVRVMGMLGGERAGKSWMTAYLGGPCIDPFSPGLTWIVGPDYSQARPEFMYLYEAWQNLGLVLGNPSMPLAATVPYSMESVGNHKVLTRSSSDVMRLSSYKVDNYWLVEAGQHPFEAYTRGLGRTSETGGALILSGTIEKGNPWYEDLYRRWQAPNTLGAKFFSLPSWSNTALYPGGREDERIKELEAETPHDQFMERYAALPQKISGVVIPEFEYDKHVKHLEFEEGVPVELWIDPGKHVYCVCFVQVIGMFTHILDVIYERGKIIDGIAAQVMGNKLFQHVDKDRAGVIDIAAKQEHADKSQVQRWRELTGCNLRFKYVHERTGYETVRSRLRDANIHHVPLLYFNDHLSNAMSANRQDALGPLAEFSLWRFPESSQRQNEAGRPVDRNNHMIKAIGYGLVDHFGVYMARPKLRPTKRYAYWAKINQ